MKKKLLLFLTSLVFCLALSVITDRAVGLFWPNQYGLIFPKNARYQFRTPEFACSVETNSLGFRDREFDRKKTAKIRILAIGDSFTYGWGVEATESWPKVLESKLRTSGDDVEVANLGEPGASPRNYADIAERSVPTLKPDLLVIAVLQGEDLAQMDQPSSDDPNGDLNKRPAGSATARDAIQIVAKFLYPNFLALISQRLEPNSITHQWKQDAQRFVSVMTPDCKARLEKLDPQVRESFLNGELNPHLIFLSITRPDYFLQTLDLNSSKVKSLIMAMGRELDRIKKTATENQAAVVVVSVPYGIYVSSDSLRTRERVGFSVVPEMLTSNTEDEAISMASRTAGIPFYGFTREFRQAATANQLYFTMDGHFNSDGQRYFAEVLVPVVKEAMTRKVHPSPLIR